MTFAKLHASLILLIAAVCATSQSSDQIWPDNAKWPGQIEGVKVEIKPILDVVEIHSDRLSGKYRSDEILLVLSLAEGDQFQPLASNLRFIRFSSRDGAVTVQPLAAHALVSRSKDEYAAAPPAAWLEFRPEERFGVLAKILRSGRTVWYAFAVSRRDVAPKRPVLSRPDWSPTFAPSQKLLGGGVAAVARLSVNETVSNIFSNQRGTWFDLVFDGTVSTNRLDPGGIGRLEFQVGKGLGPSSLDRLSLQLGVQSNQSGRAASAYAILGRTYVLPGRYSRPSHTLIVGAAPQLTAGIQGVQRWKRDDYISPYHIKPSLYYGFLRGQVGPLWLFPKNHRIGSFKRDWALFVDAGAFWIPDDKSKPGFGTRRYESFVGVTLEIPVRILFLSPALYFRTGAVEGQTFTRSSIFGLGLTMRF